MSPIIYQGKEKKKTKFKNITTFYERGQVNLPLLKIGRCPFHSTIRSSSPKRVKSIYYEVGWDQNR